MDWYLHPHSPATAARLRRQIAAYLSRHAADTSRVWAAEATIGELLGNAVDHTSDAVWVSLDWTGVKPVLTVQDLGPEFTFDPTLPDTTAERGRGLWMVSKMATNLEMTAKPGAGKRVSVTLPVPRAEEPSFDIRPREVNPLPSLQEAGPEGFGKEPFLRAIVVELALAVEEQHGPLSAQAAIARVGASIGSQMELEYRSTTSRREELTPSEVADCYIRLKAAIGGGFYVIDITDDRIVFGNTRCPFGAIVHSQPALCRMTSSVLGGIAARNLGETVVVLEERIAFNDPECRVVALLGPAAGATESGHRYGAPHPPG